MDTTADFLEAMDHLCKRPAMYVCGGTFYEVCAYLTGYAAASADCPLSNEGGEAFNRFVCRHCRFPENYAWPYALKSSSEDDQQAIERLRTLLSEFCNRARTSSYEEIIQEAAPPEIEEGEPEQTLRRLLTALLRGERKEIEPLILDHPDAPVLWEGAYPSDVAEQLDGISRSYSIGRLPGTRDSEEVRLITADFPFPITVRQVDGQWKVDVAKIVEMRKHIGGNANGERDADK